MAKKGTIAVDLDGTLAYYEGYKGPTVIGDPIPSMLSDVKNWLSEGRKVVVFTARAMDKRNIHPIELWLESHGIGGLKITNIKTPDITIIYDDRAVQVERNTGRILGNPKLIKENVKEKEIMSTKKYFEELADELREEKDTPSKGPENLKDEKESAEVNDDKEAGTTKGTDKTDSITEMADTPSSGPDTLDNEEEAGEVDDEKEAGSTGTKKKDAIVEDASTGPVGLTDMPEEGEDKDKKEAGSKGMPNQTDAMPISDKGSRDSNNKDTESDGDTSQAAGQELHPVGSMVEKGVSNNFDGESVSNQSGEASKQGGECTPTEIAKKAVTGLFA